ncbi:MAG: hypothetical protein R3B52_01975 [Candidatus Paceibacterota bacterium]
MAKNRLSKTAGLTLIELIVYLGIFVVLLGLLAAVLMTIVRVESQQRASTEVNRELLFIMNSLKTDIRQASSINVGTSSLTITGINTDVGYLLTNGVLTRKDSEETPERIHSEETIVDSLNFNELSQGSIYAVEIEITLSKDTPDPAQAGTQTLRTTVAPLSQ